MGMVSVRRSIGLLCLLGGALLVACGGGESEGGSETSSSSSKTAASSSGSGESELTVALSEWSIKPSAPAAKGGKVELKVTNNGATPHELAIVKTDVAHDKLEKAAGIVDEAKYKPLARTKQLNGAQSEELSVDLTPGKYALICNVSGHYDLGMHTAFTVN